MRPLERLIQIGTVSILFGTSHGFCPAGVKPEASTRHTARNAQIPEFVTDLGIAGALGFGTDPFIETVYNVTSINRGDEKSILECMVFGVADSLSVAARVYGIIILLDLALAELHLQLPIPDMILENPRQTALQIALTIWTALAASTVKRILLLQSVAGVRLGRVKLYDQFVDFLLANIAIYMICNELSLDIVGMGYQSIFAAGGVGAVIFGLASKDLAEHVFGGIIIQAWDAFEVGDDVVLGDGTEGTISKIGLVETEIVGYDNIVQKLPNSEISNQRVSNLSRIKKSRVQQRLRFRYSDLKALERTVLDDIIEEIKAACPKVITDGSKPLNALLSAYEPDHVEVVVNSHFEIAPGCAEYFTNRQEVLLAIARAVDKNGIQFALPSISYRTEDDARRRNDEWAP